ncbi:MAG TPA: hypothetical protein VJ922_03190 [Actinomycetota bacterium]|nr:hypothetical protein [Actinomycetota bacterium]
MPVDLDIEAAHIATIQTEAPVEPRSRWHRVHSFALAAAVVLASGAIAMAGSLTQRPDPPRSRVQQATVEQVRPIEVTVRIAVGTQPASLITGPDGIWVTTAEGLVLVDPESARVVRSIAAPEFLAWSFGVASDDFLWVQQGGVSSNAALGVVRVDRDSGETAPIAAYKSEGHGIALGFGSLWAVDIGGVVTRMDLATGRVLSRIALDGPGWGIDVGEDGVWVGGMFGVVKIDPATNSVGPRIDLVGVSDLSVGEGAIWVTAMELGGAGKESNRHIVARIDPTTGLVTKRTPFDFARAVAAGNGAVWVISEMDGSLAAIDPATGEISQIATISSTMLADVAVMNGTVWVAEGLIGGELIRIG